MKRLVAQELTLSFVPDVTQRLWRTVARRKYQSTCNRVQLQNRLECLLEEMHIKLSSLVADLIGPSARRMLRAIASGETDPSAVAALGSRRLHATPDQLRDALGACTDLHPVYRRLLTWTLDELEVIERHIQQLDEELAQLLRGHQDAVERLAAVPGLGVDSAQQIITEVGPTAATFPTAKRLASWVGACPGHDESAGINHSHRAPHGNRQMRRLLNQAANAAVKAKGSIFRARVSALGRPAWTRPSDRGDCPSPLPPGVEDPPRRRHVRGTRPGRHQTSCATPRCEDDPGTPQPRLSRRTSAISRERSGMIAGVFRPWTGELRKALGR